MSATGRLALRARRTAPLALALGLSACAVGPNYHKPNVDIPEGFKEGVDWQRAQANPPPPLSDTWWDVYQDPKLTQLIQQSLQANQSIVAAEAAYRVALATVQANVANLFPTVSAGVSATRSQYGGGAAAVGTGTVTTATGTGVYNTVAATLSASWEPDLWGGVRRSIESAKASAQATDAQLAGERLSIAASVATDYLALRQADMDVQSLKAQQDIDTRLMDMTRAEVQQGQASNDDVLVAQDNLELVIALLQSTETSREQYEHAIAVLLGVPPAAFTLAPDSAFHFVQPAVPVGLPSQLLERRYDVVVSERTAAAANARIGVAEAAFFPTLTLSAEGGFQHNRIAQLFSLPNRFWTLGPTLAETIFDGGARTAAVRVAQATYDEDVANYRGAVLTAFQNVEDSLSTVNHLRQQAQAYGNIYQRNQQLVASEGAQRAAGTASEQDLLNQQLTMLEAEQNLADSQAALAENTVALIKNLGGGWQWDNPAIPSTPAPPF